LARLHRLAEAEQAYLAAREDAAVLEFRPLLWRIEAILGSLYASQGKSDLAAAATRRAETVIDFMAETIEDAELRQQFGERARTFLPTPAAGPAAPEKPRLSPRELEVLRLLADGISDREIAAVLFISPRTVMRHVAGILAKLGVSSRTAAATLAVREGLI
jgi:DNA-binding NarL/FixJ family response regulator